MTARELVENAGLAVAAAPGYVEKREVSRGTGIVAELPVGQLGDWQETMALVEEQWRRRERTPWGYRWPTRSQWYLLIAETDELGTVRVHRHPVPRTVETVREGLAWILRIDVAHLGLIRRVQGDVYVLARGGSYRSDACPASHREEAGVLRHSTHGAIDAVDDGEIYRVTRRAGEARWATGGSRD